MARFINCGLEKRLGVLICRPLRGLETYNRSDHRAYTRGYILLPLRGLRTQDDHRMEVA